jgi:uncharacterized protein YukE
MLNRLKEWFVPPEAYQIAAQFDQQANNVCQQAMHLKQIRVNLTENWKGNSANQFQTEAEQLTKDLSDFAEWLSSKADEIRHKQVYRWIWE